MNRKDRRAAGKHGGGPGLPGGGSLFGLAVQRHQAGQLAEAESLYRRRLQVADPHPGKRMGQAEDVTSGRGNP